jgi:hypothetical protein
MTSSFLTDTWSLSETIKKFIKKNFGINHTVVVIELGY